MTAETWFSLATLLAMVMAFTSSYGRLKGKRTLKVVAGWIFAISAIPAFVLLFFTYKSLLVGVLLVLGWSTATILPVILFKPKNL